MNLHDCVCHKISGLHPEGFMSLRVGKWKYSDQELSKAKVDIIHIQTEAFHDQISRVLIKCLQRANEPATLRCEPFALGVKWVKWRSESLKLPTALGCQEPWRSEREFTRIFLHVWPGWKTLLFQGLLRDGAGLPGPVSWGLFQILCYCSVKLAQM